MIDKEIDALYIGKGNVITSHSIDLGKDNTIDTREISLEDLMKDVPVSKLEDWDKDE